MPALPPPITRMGRRCWTFLKPQRPASDPELSLLSGGDSGGPQVGNGEQARSEVLTRVPLVPLRIPSWLKVLW